MSFISYAQNFEDVIIWRALHDVRQGRYLDIGAQDPVVDSVSLAFYDAGWRGIHVEPTPTYAARLREARPDETVIEAAVTDAPGPIEFYEIPDTGLSTGQFHIAERHSKAGFSRRKIVVPCVRLDKLFGIDGDELHWLKIDVEGMESDVLRSWGNSSVRPWIAVIESTLPSTQESTQHLWIDELFARNYREVFSDGLSRYFLHDTQAHRERFFRDPANVFDGFSVTAHHFSAAILRGEMHAAEKRAEERQAEVARLGHELSVISARATASEAEIAQLNDELLATRQRAQCDRAEIARLNEELLLTAQRLTQEHREKELSLRYSREKHIVEARWRERQEAEQQLRRELRDREDEFRQALHDAETRAASTCAELARFEERAAQLQDQLVRANDAVKVADGQLAASERKIRENEEKFRQALHEVETTAASTRAELARFEERAAQLEGQLVRANEAAKVADEQRAALERKIAELRSLVDQSRAQAAEEIASARAAAALVDQALQQERAQAEQQRATLAKADALIRAVRVERPGRWERLGKALGLASPRPAWRALSSWSAASPEHDHIQSSDHETFTMPTPNDAKNPYFRANSLDELLSWHDVDFVRCAYVTVLGRQPDPEGEAFYTHRIRRGHSKMEVLWQLRKSSEGPNHDPGIAGLDRALKRAAWRRNKWFGWLFAPLLRGEGSTASMQRHRALSNELARLHRRLDDARLAPRLTTIESIMHRASEEVARLRVSLESGAAPISAPVDQEQVRSAPPRAECSGLDHLSPIAQSMYRRLSRPITRKLEN